MPDTTATLSAAAAAMGRVRSERKHAACIKSLKLARAAQARKDWKQRPGSKHGQHVRAPFTDLRAW